MSNYGAPAKRVRSRTKNLPYVGYPSDQGNVIELVKWVPTADGWVPVTERGQYINADDQHWIVARWNSIVRLPRDEWQVILP
jgi:hypothetical protein